MTATVKTAERHTCPRCAGDGFIAQFRHINNGTCLLCSGSGTRPGRARKARRPKPRTGANAQLWAEFAEAHPDEAAVVAADFEPGRPGWNRTAVLGYAYSSVATFDPRNSNPAQALNIVRDHLASLT